MELELKYKTREEWLTEATRQFRARFETLGLNLPSKLRLGCGLPSRGAFSETRRVLGQCWHASASGDGVHQIYISPTVEDGLGALGVLLHELVHACLPPDAEHGPTFKAAAHKLGLTSGKPKSAAPGPELTTECEDVILKHLGAYPHAALCPAAKEKAKGTGRMLKISCSEGHEEYVLRGSRKVIDLGLPACPLCGNELKEPEGEGEEDAG